MTMKNEVNRIIDEALTAQRMEGFMDGTKSASTIILDALTRSGVTITLEQIKSINDNLPKAVEAYLKESLPEGNGEKHGQQD